MWVRTLETVEDTRLASHEWLDADDEPWPIEKHRHRSPARPVVTCLPLRWPCEQELWAVHETEGGSAAAGDKDGR